MQNDAGGFVDLHVLWQCSASSRITGVKDHRSTQMSVAEVNKVTGRVNVKAPQPAQNEPLNLCWWLS
uniref:Uncharacterized protein n=1 Tax=Castor canadensis TaxID=51338 RepID=A0A8C0XGH5_CASCN